MDKELLRIVIIGTGFVVILGMVLWSYIKNKNSEDDLDVLDREKAIGASGTIEEMLRLHTDRDDFDIVPVGTKKRTPDIADESAWVAELDDDFSDEPTFDDRNVLPEIIQFYVVAKNDEDFNGVALALAFANVDLEFGNLKVYERINKNAEVEYGVACMVEPGTFPDGTYLAAFTCPGIIFYLQHQEVEDAQRVFDDFVDTIKTVATELNAEVWDHQRQPLTEETIQAIRRSL